MKQIDTGTTPYVWATDTYKNVYYLGGNKFGRVEGNLKYVSSGGAGVWGLDSHNNIYFREGVKESNPLGSDWKNVGGGLSKIDSGPEGMVCGITSSFRPVCRKGLTYDNPSGTKWQKLSGRMKDISCGIYGCWAINKQNRVYFTSHVDGWSTKWIKIGCDTMVQIDVGPNGQVWGVNDNKELFTRIGVSQSFPSGFVWKKIGTKNFIYVTFGWGKIYATDTANTTFVGTIMQENSSGLFVLCLFFDK